MTGDIYLGKIAGIPFRLHWSWFLALFLISWTLSAGFFPQTLPEHAGEPQVYWVLGLLAALGLFISILLHELGHCFVALRFDVPVRGIRLFVFGGIAELGREPAKPSHEILIAVGGPIVTLVLVVVYNVALSFVLAASGIEWALLDNTLQLRGGALAAQGAAAVLFYLGMINSIVLIFNLIPAFPLDGGRVLRGIVWAATRNFLTGTRVAGGVGIAFAWLLFVFGVINAFQGNLLGGVWLFFLGTFLQHAAQSSIAYAQLQQLLRGVRVRDMMTRDPVTVPAGLSLRDVADRYFLRYPYKAYPVVDGDRVVGLLTLRAMQELPQEEWDTLRAGEVARQHETLPAIDPDEPVLRAMQKLAESDQSRLGVVSGGQLVGLLCARDVMDLLEIRAGLSLPRTQATAGPASALDLRGSPH